MFKGVKRYILYILSQNCAGYLYEMLCTNNFSYKWLLLCLSLQKIYTACITLLETAYRTYVLYMGIGMKIVNE